MDDGNTTAANVAAAIAISLDCASSPDARRAAVGYLESVKGGDIRVLANTSLLLIQKDCSSEIRLHGFKMLQHLVRFRWHEFTIQERHDFAKVAISLIVEMDPHEEWALRSQSTALVAEVVRSEGVVLWQELLPSLVSLSNKGPVEAELVAMMLRWLPEDITVHNEDLEGDRRRILLRGLTDSLTEILPLLYTLLESHFGAALSEYNRQQIDVAKKHVAAVIAALNAINAYAEWAPLPDFAKYNLIHGCGFLLSSPEFRVHACEFFKLVSRRKRPHDATACEFNSAMTNVFKVLMEVTGDFLNKYSTCSAIADESEIEFAERICESMVALGSSHMHCITQDWNMTSRFLQLMLGLFQHYKFALHFQALIFWLTLMRESLPKGRYVVPTNDTDPAVDNLGLGSTQANKEKKGLPNFVNDDICAVLLDVSLQRMIKKSNIPEYISKADALELWSDEFDGSDFGQYRSRLLEFIKLVASQKPVVAVARVSQRLDIILKSSSRTAISAEDFALMESMQPGLEAIVSAIFDGSADLNNCTSEIKFQLHEILKGLLQQLLSLKWTEPPLAVLLAHYLDALGPYLKNSMDSITPVVNKIFELLTSLPLILKDPSNIARHARLQVCASFIRIAKAAHKSLLPLMKGIADTMALLQAEGRLLRGEHNILGEAFIVMASSAGVQQQQEVLAWLLEPLSKQWVQLEWQNAFLSDPLGLTRLCSDPPLMWNIFHTVTFFEKALKRSGHMKANMNPQGSSLVSDGSACPHPISRHLSWMLPPLIRLLRIIHSLWSPTTAQALTGELRGAKCMSQIEQASLLGEGNQKLPKGPLMHADGSQIDIHREGVPNENDIRNWLKGIRDSGYNVIGLSANSGDSFFNGLDCSHFAMAFMEDIQSMDFRHIRQLIHLVLIPIVKSCPADLRVGWLEKLLHPLFLHCQQALSCSWSSLMREGRAKVPDTFGSLSGMELKLEVMEEKLLRDLTREICHLFSVLASPALNGGLPSLEQLGHLNRTESSSLNQLDAFSSNSMIGFLITQKSLALPALKIIIEAFTWTDGEAVAKVASFCGAIILLAVAADNVELREFVAKDLFYAIIQGLFLESNAVISSDLVGLCREIYVYLSNRDPAPRQILLSLPCITEGDLVSFEDALTKTSSPKEQKLHMRSLLQLGSGNKLRALAAQKTTNSITNVTARSRSSTTAPAHSSEEDNAIGLAAIIT